MTTETLDKMYLEWSQFTKARTKREIQYESLLRKILRSRFDGKQWEDFRKQVAHALESDK